MILRIDYNIFFLKKIVIYVLWILFFLSEDMNIFVKWKKKNIIRFFKEDNEEFMLGNLCFGVKIGWFLELFYYLFEKNFIVKDFWWGFILFVD